MRQWRRQLFLVDESESTLSTRPGNACFRRNTQPLMTTEIEQNRFLKKWREALRALENAENHIFWEGGKACSELNRIGYLQRARMEGLEGHRRSGIDDAIGHHMLLKLWSEVEEYRQKRGAVRTFIDSAKIHRDWLDRKGKECRGMADRLRSTDRDLALDLDRIAKTIHRAIRGIDYRSKERWKYPDLDNYVPYRGYRIPQQERELDSRFQVRIAVILRTFMMQDPTLTEKEARDSKVPSLTTIARLVVLFLVCTDLAKKVDRDAVELLSSAKRITVRAVVQKLRDSGIDDVRTR